MALPDEESGRPLKVSAPSVPVVSSRPAHGPGEESGGVPGFWSCLAWWWLVRPRSLLWAAVLVVAVVLAGGLAGVVLGGRSACEARTARALSEFGYVAERLQEKVTIRTLPVVSLATFVRQTPFFPELAEEFGSVAADLLRSEKAIANIQLVPGGVVSAVYPPGNEGALGHDLFRDPNRRGDLLRAVRGAPGMSISNPVVLMREGQSGRAIFARYPVFVDGPVANRTAEFGFDDAYDCGQLCYGDPGHVFWGLTTALVDFDTLLQFSGLTTLEEEEGVCFVLRTGRVFQATDLVSNNNTIYSSSCKATRPVVMVVSVPNDQWFLEIGYPGECTPWVLPAAIAVCAVTLGALVVLLLFVHQSLENRILAELRHASEVEQLQERQKQIAREEAGLGSDAIRLLVSSLSSVNTSPLPILRTFLKGNRDESLHGKIRSSTSFSASSIVMDPGLSMSVTNLARYGQGDVLVISKVYRLADMRSANPASCSDMLSAVHDLTEALAGEYHGQCIQMNDEASIIGFKEAKQAVMYALRLRKTILDSTWPERILVLPSCEPQPMAVKLQPKAKGPQLQTVIDLATPQEEEDLCRMQLVAAAAPRQILMTAQAFMKLADSRKLAGAGFPDIEHLGFFVVPAATDSIPLFNVNDPAWDLRLPQLPLHQQLPRLQQVSPGRDNIWELPRAPGEDLAVVAMSLEQVNQALLGHLSPSEELICKLLAPIKSMQIIFGGFLVTPHSAWMENRPSVMVFPNSDCALSFSICLQLALLHAPWTEEELDLWGRREVGMLGKLCFSGPRVKCAATSQPAHVVPELLEGKGARVSDTSVALLDVMHGGQVVVTTAAMPKSTMLTTKEERFRIVDLGEHLLREGGEPLGLKELQLLDVARTFPPLKTFKAMAPGYHASPDPSQPCAFVYCQAVCSAGTKVSSSHAYAAVLNDWKQLATRLAASLKGYEIHSKGSSLGYAFSSLEAGISFAVGMQKSVMQIAMPPELASHQAFGAKMGSSGQILFKGVPIKVGISYGLPVLRRPVRATGRANYQGPVVQLGVRSMLSACPGQILVAGKEAAGVLEVTQDMLEATLRDQKQEPLVVSSAIFEAMNCPVVHVRLLGYFKAEEQGNTKVPMFDVVPPELSEREFSLPPGRVGATVSQGDEPAQKSGERKRSGKVVREHTLASIMSDILDQRLISKPRCAEEKVKVLGILGQGMQGKVMLGLWKGVKVAYKVVQLPIAMSKHDNAHARALLEMAISATMAHPNVVQTYSYEMVHIEPTSDNALVGDASTDAAEIIDSTQVGNDEDAGRFDPVLEDVDSCSAREAVQSGIHEARLIQELCDSKTLRYNLDNKKLVLSGEEFPHLGLALMLANDIACGMQHIHSQNIIHGDLKALNVLLTSSTRKTYYKETMLPNLLAKVSDFGLSARLSTEQTHVSNVHSGTMTHMAPEVLLAGQLSKASDVYAFGIILYELFSGKRPFEGLSMQQVMHHVGTLGKRPVFLPGVPVRVVELACLCWGPVDKRPTFPEIVTTLRALLNDFKMGLLTSRRAMPVSGFNSKSSDEEQAMPNGSPGQNRNVASSASSSSFEPSTDMGDIRALQMGGHARPIFQQQLPTARAE